MKQRIGVLASMAILLGAAAVAAQAPAYSDGLYAVLKTTRGVIVLQLEFEKTPMTVASFVGLAEGTVENKALPPGTPFFDGTVFHRVVPGHVIQAGMPRTPEPPAGAKRVTEPGYTIPNEIVAGLDHGRAGMLGMANSGPHTNTCQWYITLGDRSYLDGNYSVFGHVVLGMDVVTAVVQGDVVEKVSILRVGRKAEAFRPDTAVLRRLVAEVQARVRAADEQKAKDEEAYIRATYPTAVSSPKGSRFLVTQPGTGDTAPAGALVRVRYTGRLVDGRAFVSSSEDGKPMTGAEPQAFDYVVGKTRLTPGLEEALAGMKKGERRTVIVRGDQAYAGSGFYGKELPGQKRLVIPPATLVVYDVEVQ
jgi:cyclophilin family peptidyl-prolyl cis-trans isomerase